MQLSGNNPNFDMSVLFYRGRSLISRLIQKFDGRYSHCCLVLEGNKVFESDRFTKSRVIHNPYKPDDYDLLTFHLSESQYHQLNKLIIQFSGFGYDYSRFLGFLLQKIFKIKRPHFMNNKYNFLCSEIVEIILGGIGVIPIDKEFCDRTPTELYFHLLKLLSDKREISLETED